MRRCLTLLLLLAVLPAFADGIEKGRIVKMLPLFLDQKGRDAISPSLYDRDAYQAHLRQHTNEISGIRCDVLWQVENPAAATYRLRVELQGIGAGGQPTRSVLEITAPPPLLRRWNSLVLDGAAYRNLGQPVAWRATLWRGDQLLSEQKSFLW
jgi:hypothetical protein